MSTPSDRKPYIALLSVHVQQTNYMSDVCFHVYTSDAQLLSRFLLTSGPILYTIDPAILPTSNARLGGQDRTSTICLCCIGLSQQGRRATGGTCTTWFDFDVAVRRPV